MGTRFSRRIKIAPGLRLNISGSGVSLTAGGRGASVTYGKKGTYGNLGIVGTGLSYRARLDKPSVQQNDMQQVFVRLVLHDNGTLEITDQEGRNFSDGTLRKIKNTYKSAIENFLNERAKEKNEQLKSVLEIHFDTPAPHVPITYLPKSFYELPPSKPVAKRYGLFGTLFKKVRAKIDKQNQDAQVEFDDILSNWQFRRDKHDDRENEIKDIYDIHRFESKEGMEKCLEHRVSEINWPLETEMACYFSDDLKVAWLDVDLPEAEDMPIQSAIVSSRPLGLTLKKISDTEIRKNYMQHTHGILFRLIGETFAYLPTVQKIVISAYSQRTSKIDGQINDEYLISIEMERTHWETYNFSKISSIDPVLAFEQCNLRRNMTKTGVFKPIEPFEIVL